MENHWCVLTWGWHWRNLFQIYYFCWGFETRLKGKTIQKGRKELFKPQEFEFSNLASGGAKKEKGKQGPPWPELKGCTPWLLSSHWPEPSHMTLIKCNASWEMETSGMHRDRKWHPWASRQVSQGGLAGKSFLFNTVILQFYFSCFLFFFFLV